MDNRLIEILHKDLINFHQVLQKDLERTDSFVTSGWSLRTDLLRAMCKKPEASFSEYSNKVPEYGNVFSELKKNRLGYVNDRQQIVKKIDVVSLEIMKFIVGCQDNIQAGWDNIAKIIFSKTFYVRRIEGKLLLIYLTDFTKWDNSYKSNLLIRKNIKEIKKTISFIASHGSYQICTNVAKRIATRIGEEYGVTKKRSRADLAKSALEDLESSNEIEDYKTATLILQKELEIYKEDTEAEIKAKIDNFKIAFFSKMNSPQLSFLLDTVYDLTSQIENPNSQLNLDSSYSTKSIEILSYMFMNLLKDSDVKPIKKIGTTISITQDELEGFRINNYEDDISKKSRILANVTKSGWKYGQLIISKPEIIIIG